MCEHIDDFENRHPEGALDIDLSVTYSPQSPAPAYSPLLHRHARTDCSLVQIILPMSQRSLAKKFVIENGPTNLELRVSLPPRFSFRAAMIV